MLGEDTKHKTKFHIHDLNFFLRVENMVYLTVETEHAQKSVVITCIFNNKSGKKIFFIPFSAKLITL